MPSSITRREFLKHIGQGSLGLYVNASLMGLTACNHSQKRMLLTSRSLSGSSPESLSPLNSELLRYPYVQNPTPSSMTLAWKTKKPCKGEVLYGLTPELEQTTMDVMPTDSHVVNLSNLKPDTLCYYQIFGDGMPITEMEAFRTAKLPGSKSFSFIAFGDSGDGSKDQYRVADVMKSLDFDLAILTGDIVYPRGEAEDFEPHYFRPYQDLIKKVPFFPSLGNHDIKSKNGQAYLEAFHVPQNNPLHSKRYYSFRYANALFIALDSNDKLLFEPDQIHGSPQFSWLRHELQSAEQDAPIDWRFVFFHHAPYSSGYHGQWLQKERLAQLRKTIIPLFEQYQVDMVLTGHDHHYERTYPIRGGSIEKRELINLSGIVYVITGGGGKGNNFWRRYYRNMPWTAHLEEAFHVTHIEINGGQLTLKAIDDRGDIIDRAIIQKPII